MERIDSRAGAVTEGENLKVPRPIIIVNVFVKRLLNPQARDDLSDPSELAVYSVDMGLQVVAVLDNR
tara:strand:+ start:14860 stop:15060 length:201 start_codon:yes stop_codon:yes gene_type:complete